MKRIFLRPKNFWKDLPVSRKLYVVVGIMALLIATELFTLLFAMDTLSAVRALVEGEGTWSKAQKNALLEIQSYARTRDEQYYLAFRKDLEIPLGDHQARLELQNPNMDIQKVTDGFAAGKIHPHDIPNVIKLLRRFYQVSYIEEATDVWARADDLIWQLIDTSDQLHQAIATASNGNHKNEIQSLHNKILEINNSLTALENQFSSVLGEASRWLEHLLMILLVIAVATVESTGLTLTVVFSRSLTRVLNELHEFASEVGAGELNRTVPVRSRDELGRLAAGLNKMAADLKETTGERIIAERSNRIKNLFLANMSHEIRTPLSAILGFVELLKDPSLSDDERRKFLDIIERTGYSLATIINDILDISKVEAGKLEVEKNICNLKQSLKDLESLLSLRCEEKGIDLKFRYRNIPEFIVTDATRLKQIFLNVIGNAIKFTDRGRVTVTFVADNELLLCSVRDTGIGIEPGNVGRLFQPFSQIDLSIRKKFGGTGLGLMLSRRLAQLMGGDVVLKRSQKGKGSTFVVSMALKVHRREMASAFPTPDQRSSNWQGLRGKRILVVEDSLDNQLLARQYLARAGAEVHTANHGLEAVEITKKMQFDVVLMDMQMPVMDGYAATSQLRDMGCTTPIIALTGHAMKEDLEKCISAGCNDFLSKPYRRDGFLAMVARHCRAAA